MRYFINPYPDYRGSSDIVDTAKVKRLIESYAKKLSQHSNAPDGSLYVGSSGIAFAFLKLHQSQLVESLNPHALQNAKKFIDHARKFIGKKTEDSASLLCGNAGIFAVSAVIHQNLRRLQMAQEDRNQFNAGYQVCLQANFNRHGSDEILFGRAGYLSGAFWMNQHLPVALRIKPEVTSKICDVMIEAGLQYSRSHNLNIPMMWECYGKQYLGAAHGICGILHMILESPMFSGNLEELSEKQYLVKETIDAFLRMQNAEGNLPSAYGKPDLKLIHWCHGAPGAVYLFAKAYLVFKDCKYLDACLLCGDLVWDKGLLRKGPGICHGVAGNGYVFLLLYRLTNEQKHLYRAAQFADFLTHDEFLQGANTPDRPMSLYEGLAGTICFLIDLLQPEKASFPFMDVFDVKY